jgi:hypothetical protein
LRTVVERRVTVTYHGDKWVGEWIRYKEYTDRNGKTGPNRYLVISKKMDEVLTPISSLNLKYSQITNITELITSKRVEKLQKGFNVSESDDVLLLTERILHAAWSGEWMGQSTHNQDFCIEDLAKILGKDFPTTWVLVATLKEHEKADIEGHIIVPYKKSRQKEKTSV